MLDCINILETTLVGRLAATFSILKKEASAKVFNVGEMWQKHGSHLAQRCTCTYCHFQYLACRFYACRCPRDKSCLFLKTGCKPCQSSSDTSLEVLSGRKGQRKALQEMAMGLPPHVSFQYIIGTGAAQNWSSNTSDTSRFDVKVSPFHHCPVKLIFG